jgi:hypothetical protein
MTDAQNELHCAGFGRRFGAMWLDFVFLLPLVLTLGTCGLAGCAALGPQAAVNLVMTGGFVLATNHSMTDQIKSDQQLARHLETELKPLLRPRAQASKSEADHLSATVSQSRMFITATGDFAPDSIGRFNAGIRTLAWRHALETHVSIHTDRRSPEENTHQLSEFIRSLLPHPRVKRWQINPRTEVSLKLGALVPCCAMHATIWGKKPGMLYLEAGKPRIVAGGDFSPAQAVEFISAAKLSFPDIAVAVYRDVGKAKDEWELVATYDPKTRH